MATLELELFDSIIMGRHSEFGKSVDPLEDQITRIMIGVDSGGQELTLVDLDGDFNITDIDQIQDNTSESEVRQFVNDNIDKVIEWAKDRIANLISN